MTQIQQHKKIIFLTHVGNPGGAELCLLSLCAFLKEQGHFTCFQEGSLPAMVENMGISSSVLPMPHQIHALRREDGIGRALRMIPSICSFLKRLVTHIRPYDIVVCISQKSFVCAVLAKPFTRKPIIWFMNDLLTSDHFNPWMIRLMVHVFSRCADHIIVNSQASYDAWVISGGRTHGIDILYPGTKVEAIITQVAHHQRAIAALKTQLSPDALPIIGMFGRISPWKGQDVFIRAIAALPNVRGIIVGGAQFGESHYHDQLEGLIDELGVRSRITFLGHQEDVTTYMAACDVVAHCSTAPEPFGLVIVEAMCCGVPVVISDAGGAKEIIMPHPLMKSFPLGDVSELVKNLDALLHMRVDHLSSYREAALMRARQLFSIESMYDKFHAILKKIT
ncbi:MAG: glycosyltransferase family 1 protein [Alphaproteobacteria bacterium]|nr:MAG: glycosyltransferase family 1 protein [Alphaproteobacteria bacterium]TAF13308.1 MAG: glycosyltransferase family 1 protein [Alphaproteobacteria bacterium]